MGSMFDQEKNFYFKKKNTFSRRVISAKPQRSYDIHQRKAYSSKPQTIEYIEYPDIELENETKRLKQKQIKRIMNTFFQNEKKLEEERKKKISNSLLIFKPKLSSKMISELEILRRKMIGSKINNWKISITKASIIFKTNYQLSRKA